MPSLNFVTADVFTDTPFGGNPLAVFPDAPALSTEAMQRIAREFNLSETVFVFPARDARNTRQLRIFTPAKELPFAGHPTVGTAIVLAERGLLGDIRARLDIVFEEGAGPVPVRIERKGGSFFAALSAPKMPRLLADAPPPREAIAGMLSLDVRDLAADVEPGFYSVAFAFLFVPLKDRAALARVQIETGAWARVLKDAPGKEVFAFTMDNWRSGREIYARMFGPALGIVEDPATGSAAATAAGFLAALQKLPDGTHAYTIHQGIEMGRPSRLELEIRLNGGGLAGVEVGGRAVLLSEGRFLAS